MANACRSVTGGSMTAGGVRRSLAGVSEMLFRGALSVEDGGGTWTLDYGRRPAGEPGFRIELEEGGEISWRHVPDRDLWWLGTCVACKVIRAAARDGGYVDESDGLRGPADFDRRYPTLASWRAALGGGRILGGLARLSGSSLGREAGTLRMDGRRTT